MKTIILIITFYLLYFNILKAQNCDCLEQFNYIVNYYEKNNPAFQLIESDKRELSNYKEAVLAIKMSIPTEPDNDLCNKYFNQYLQLLKDNHSSIELNLQRSVDLSTVEKIENFNKTALYQSFEKRDIDTLNIIQKLKNNQVDDIEGIYYSESNIRIAILRTKLNFYEGIVLNKNKLLDVGHVLLKITKN